MGRGFDHLPRRTFAQLQDRIERAKNDLTNPDGFMARLEADVLVPNPRFSQNALAAQRTEEDAAKAAFTVAERELAELESAFAVTYQRINDVQEALAADRCRLAEKLQRMQEENERAAEAAGQIQAVGSFVALLPIAAPVKVARHGRDISGRSNRW